MNTREKTLFAVAAAAGLLVIAVLVFLLYAGDDGPKGLSDRSAAAAGDGGGGAPGVSTDIQGADAAGAGAAIEKVAPSAAGGEAARARRGPEGKGVIEGRVLAEQAGSLAGARVVFRTQGASDSVLDDWIDIEFEGDGGEREDEIAAVTGPDGRFSLAGLPAAEKAFLVVSHGDYVARSLPLGAYQGDAKNVGDIVLELGGRIAGYVGTPTGAPIRGAVVRARPSDTIFEEAGGMFVIAGAGGPGGGVRAETDENGRYVLAGVPAGNVLVTGRHSDHPSAARRKVQLDKGETAAGVDLVLEPGLAISGTVRDAAGDPVEGVNVATTHELAIDLSEFAHVGSYYKAARTGPDGGYMLRGLSEGEYALKAAGSIYLPASRPGVAAGSTGVDFVLTEGGTVCGRLFNARTGREVEDFEMTARAERDGERFSGVILKGAEAAAIMGSGEPAEGAYCVRGLGPEAVTVEVTADGYARSTFTGLAAGPGETVRLDFDLTPESRISGIVLAPGGEPVEGARLELTPKHDAPGDPLGGRSITRRAVRGAGDGEEIVFDDGSAITERSSPDGRFVFRSVPEADYELRASHDEYASPGSIAVEAREGEHQSGIEITMLLGGGVAGTVYGKDGQPMPGARVRLRPESAGPFEHKNATADIDGHFEIRGLEPGIYYGSLAPEEPGGFMMSIVLEQEGPAEGETTVVVTEGETTELDLFDLPTCTVAGRVTEAGEPVGRIGVQLFPAKGLAIMPTRSVMTDDDGLYVMEDVRAGSYRVQLDLAGLPEAIEETVQILPGGRADQDFSLPSGRISGRITDAATGAGIAGITVRLERPKAAEEEDSEPTRMSAMFVSVGRVDDGEGGGGSFSSFTIGGPSARANTDAEGRFEIKYLKEGTYRLVAEGMEYMKGSLENVSVREDRKTQNADIVLARGSVIAGMVVDAVEGGGVQYCPVSCVRLDEAGNPMDDTRSVVMSGGDGSFRIEGLEEGRYRLSSERHDYQGELQVDVDAGEERTDVRLKVSM